jgi:hypothetical protein
MGTRGAPFSYLCDELFRPTAQHDGSGHGTWATLKEVKALAAHLLLLERLARANHLRHHVVHGGLRERGEKALESVLSTQRTADCTTHHASTGTNRVATA